MAPMVLVVPATTVWGGIKWATERQVSIRIVAG